MTEYSPTYVLGLNEPTTDFLCDLSANTYGLDFLGFAIRDAESGSTLFELKQEQDSSELPPPTVTCEEVRTIQYHLGPDFLELRSIGTTLLFAVGAKEVKNLRMIERHYFREQLVKSFDFTFPFCPPNTTNTWEFIYEMPALSDALKAEMIAAPYETRSDSFYFVDDVLVMHNKAEYNFSPYEVL
jgi:hypothetical protein